MTLPAKPMWPLGLLLVPALVLASPAAVPERERHAPPQPRQVPHTLRQIPEACTRLEGSFSDDPAHPYSLQAVRTRPDCQPRAQFHDAASVQPSAAAGWVLNEVIRVPADGCGQVAMVEVWRLPAGSVAGRDGQGQQRVYLEQARQQAGAGQLARLPAWSARVAVQGSCSGDG